MHLEALPKENKDVFKKLSKFSDFYLAGGTALALQIGHRISIYFDFFNNKEINKNLLNKIKKVFFGRKINISVSNPDELTVFVDQTKITFLKYPFPPTLNLINFKGINLLNVKEIAASKAYTVGRRGSFKDYIDLYYIILEKHTDLNKIIRMAEKKYGNEFNSRLFLEQLIYLEDITDEQIIFLKEKTDKKTLKSFFEDKIREINLID